MGTISVTAQESWAVTGKLNLLYHLAEIMFIQLHTKLTAGLGLSYYKVALQWSEHVVAAMYTCKCMSVH